MQEKYFTHSLYPLSVALFILEFFSKLIFLICGKRTKRFTSNNNFLSKDTNLKTIAYGKESIEKAE
jgi:hypothetical protein